MWPLGRAIGIGMSPGGLLFLGNPKQQGAYVFYTTKLRLRSAIKERCLYCVSEGFVFSLLSYWGWIKPLNNRGLWQPAKKVLEYV